MGQESLFKLTPNLSIKSASMQEKITQIVLSKYIFIQKFYKTNVIVLVLNLLLCHVDPPHGLITLIHFSDSFIFVVLLRRTSMFFTTICKSSSLTALPFILVKHNIYPTFLGIASSSIWCTTPLTTIGVIHCSD